MSDQETGEEKEETHTGIDIPELGPITFTSCVHKLPVSLRFETTQVHFDTFETYDNIPIELLREMQEIIFNAKTLFKIE